MLLAMAAVNVVLDGRLLVGSRPAMLNGGVILAPLDPFVRRFADRIDVDITRSIVRIARRERSITVPIAPYVREEQIVIPLALVVRALGATAYYEGWRTTLSIVSPPGDQIATPTPYATLLPLPAPRVTFTPPPVPTPLPTVTGIPQPRRTPIWVRAKSYSSEPPR